VVVTKPVAGSHMGGARWQYTRQYSWQQYMWETEAVRFMVHWLAGPFVSAAEGALWTLADGMMA